MRCPTIYVYLRSHAGEFYFCQLRDEPAAVSLLLQLFIGWQVDGYFSRTLSYMEYVFAITVEGGPRK